jgi:hypothetical protein
MNEISPGFNFAHKEGFLQKLKHVQNKGYDNLLH